MLSGERNQLTTGLKPEHHESSVYPSSSMGKSTRVKRTQEIYILYPFPMRIQRKIGLSHFFSQDFLDVDEKIQGLPVFFKLSTAIHHARCIGARYMVLKAVVDEVAIQGEAQGKCSLKPGFLVKHNIQTATPAWSNAVSSIINTSFA